MWQSLGTDDPDAIAAGEAHDQRRAVEALLAIWKPGAKQCRADHLDLGLAAGTTIATELLDELLDLIHQGSLVGVPLELGCRAGEIKPTRG